MAINNSSNINIFIFTWSTGVSVRWNQPQFSPREGDTIMVCAEQAGQTERAYSVNVFAPTADGTYVYVVQ